MLFFEGRALRLVTPHSCSDAKDAGTVNAEISELVQMWDADIQRLRPAHGKTGHGAVLAVGVNAIALLHLRHDVSHKLWFKFTREWHPKAEGAGMPVRHHDHHGLGFSGGDEV